MADNQWKAAIQRLREAFDLHKGHYNNLNKKQMFLDSKGGGVDIYSIPTFPYNIFRIGKVENPFWNTSSRIKGPNYPLYKG